MKTVRIASVLGACGAGRSLRRKYFEKDEARGRRFQSHMAHLKRRLA